MTGVIYARYSAGPKQTDQSIEGQVADCRAYAEQEGISILSVYADRHISGKSMEGRDEFLRMLHDAERGMFDCVIVWKIDRFGRNRHDIAICKHKLKKAGVELKYARESVPEGPEGIILESVLEGLAEYYSADLRQKVTRGMREAAKKGRYPGGHIPVGFAYDNDHHIIINEPAAAAIREAFRMHIAGSTTKEIMAMMDRSGFPMSKTSVGYMLRNERYTGAWSFGDIEMDVPAIIDEETFEMAQRSMKTRRNNAAGKAKVNYLLSCRCTCGYCGGTVAGESGKGRSGKVYNYYKCSHKKRGSQCKLKPIPQEKLEKVIIEDTMTYMLDDKVIDEIVKKIMEIQEKQQTSDYLKSLQSRLKDAERRKSNLLRLAEQTGEIEGIPERIREITREMKDLEAEIKKEELGNKIIPEDVIRYWLDSFKDGDADDDAFKKRLVETFISKIELTNDSAIIYYNKQEKSSRGVCSTASRKVERSGLYPNIPTPHDDYIILLVPLKRK